MKDQLVSFKVAKLAKEKGFAHMKSNCYGDNMCYELPEGELINALKGNTVTGCILAPTQSLLQRWLRETHLLDVSVTRSTEVDVTYLYFVSIQDFRSKEWTEHSIAHIWNYKEHNLNVGSKYISYEEAIEEGLFESLKLI